MAKLTFLGKTVDALHLLRQTQSTLSRDARTLLVLIDGTRHERELKRLAASNGVTSFEETLAQLVKAGLVQELGDPDEGALTVDGVEADYSDANLITMDFTCPVRIPDKPATGTGPPAAPAAATQPAAAASHAQVEQAIREQLAERLRPEVEKELRVQLLPAIRTAIVRELTVKLEATLRPLIEKRLHARLEAELRPRIEQELRAGLDADAGGRDGAPDLCLSRCDTAPNPGTSLPA